MLDHNKSGLRLLASFFGGHRSCFEDVSFSHDFQVCDGLVRKEEVVHILEESCCSNGAANILFFLKTAEEFREYHFANNVKRHVVEPHIHVDRG